MTKKNLFLLLLSIGVCSCVKKEQPVEQVLESNQVMNWEQFKNDLAFVDEEELNDLPLGFGIFPVADYDSEGNGSMEEQLVLGDSTFVRQTAMVYKGTYNSHFFKDVGRGESELGYFTILVQTTYDSPKNNSFVSSRNHPVYVGEGLIYTDAKRKIKWVAIQNNVTNLDIAIVNMKYFDLTKGRVIVVLPMDDGSLRFKQLNISQQNDERLIKEIKSQTNEIERFITKMKE